MKQYPTISQKIQNIPAYVFDKLDGSNIRAEWEPKKGFWKFGSRSRLLGSDQPVINKADEMIKQKYGEDLSKIFKDQRYQKVVAFFEFWGPHSFAGHHEDENHTVTLFDVSVHKKGFIPPNEFIKIYGHLDIPRLLFMGNVNDEIVEKIRNSQMEGLTFEGVVCKAKLNKEIIMFKIKTLKWLQMLKDYCHDDMKLFELLK
jgi:hypothetical protein